MISQVVEGQDLEARFAGFQNPAADHDHMLAAETAREKAARLGVGAPRVN